MSTGRLSEVASMVTGALRGADRSYVGVSTDTRTLKSGELYVALTGPNFDGHAFLGRAEALGAAGALVATAQDSALPQVVAGDTRLALARFSNAWRQRFNIDVVAVTGSNGKTSVKQMLGAILATRGETLATRGNFNNEIGVPLTLLRLRRAHRAAVIEIGASGPAEVGELAQLALPHVGIVNNAAAAHLEGFGGSVEHVARAKGELFSALPADGCAIINADDAFCNYWKELAGARRIITFGQAQDADVAYSNVTQAVTSDGACIAFDVRVGSAKQRIELPAAGRHNACNAAAAIAACHALGLDLEQCARGLANVDMAEGRLQIKQTAVGARVIDDSYNANPASVRAAIEFLADQGTPGWLVLGDMIELGEDERELHAQIGKYARECGIRRLYATGDLSRSAVTAFGEHGYWFETVEDMSAALVDEVGGDLNVLVKASRSMRLERIVDALCSLPSVQAAGV